jgi:protocatechuate 3,4-dioxygenase beta subunit
VAPKVDAVAGSVTIRGRLVDRQKAPRGGVEVTMSSWPVEIVEMVGIDGPRSGKDPKTKTGADGRFSFALGKGRSGNLTLESSVVFAKESPTFGSKSDCDLGDLETYTASRVSGTVRDAAGLPVVGVKVTAGLGENGDVFARRESQTVSDAQGAFTVDGLSQGTWRLRTASGSHLPTTLALELAVEEHKQGVVLTVSPGKAIAGQVLDDRGVPVAGIQVGSNRKEARGAMSVQRFVAAEAAMTDKGGYFTLANLDGETVTVRAFGKGYTTVTEAMVAVGTGNLVLRVQRTAVIAGVLRDGAGHPIAGSRVSGTHMSGDASGIALDPEGLPMMSSGGGMATTAADGTFRLENVKPGSVVVRAEGKLHRPAKSQPIVVAPAQTVDGVVLVAPAGATARVLVQDASGKPVAKARVVVQAPPERDQLGGNGTLLRAVSVSSDEDGDAVFGPGMEQAFGSAVTDESGHADVVALPAKSAVVVAKHDDYADSAPVAVQLPAEGLIEVKVTLRSPGFADVLVMDAAGVPTAAQMSLHGPIGGSDVERDQELRAGADGKVRTPPLLAGEYWVEARSKAEPRHIGGAQVLISGDQRSLRQSRVTFRIDAGKTTLVTVTLPMLATVHGIVRDAAGPAAKVEVELLRVEEASNGAMPQGFGGGPSTQTDADGSYRFEQVEMGRYRLRFGRPTQVAKANEFLDVPANTADVSKDLTMQFGTVRLQVVDKASGSGLAGAEIELEEQSGPAAGSASQPKRQHAVVMSMVMSSDDSAGGGEMTTMTLGSQRARTGVDGNVELKDVPPGLYTIVVNEDGHSQRKLVDQSVVANAVTDPGRVELEAAGRIRGKVLGADGKPVQMAMVSLSRIGDSDPPAQKPAMSGVFTFSSLSPGKYQVAAVPIGPPGSKGSDPVTVELGAGQKIDTLELHMPAR